MTDDDKELVEWLREMANEYDSGHHESWPTIDAFNQAADRIEAQAAEIEQLRKENDIRQGRIDRLEKLHLDIIARAALGEGNG